MQLTLWTYEGPPHVGAMRVATAMADVHYVLHAPQGDTYADLLFTMIERNGKRPPVTYTTFQARDLGGDTAQRFQDALADAWQRSRAGAILVGASCTGELIQDDPAGLARAAGLPVPVVPLDLPSYQRKENWGASETFYQLVRTLCPKPAVPRAPRPQGQRPRANLLGATALGFRHRDDVTELRRLLAGLGIDVHVCAPLGASVADIARLGEADVNVVMYPEQAELTATWLKRQHGQPHTTVVPIGMAATRAFVAELLQLAGLPADTPFDESAARAPWYARSVDSNYLTGKRVFVFGDATHACAAARVASQEFGFTVVGLGTYSREFAKPVREAAQALGLEALISDDHLAVEAAIAAAEPELVLGTQMERHIAKRLGIPCAVISAPVHVQDFPARYAPQMGCEGANVLFDTWVHPLMMGLEEHLLQMFRGDAEFHPDAQPSHLGHGPRGAPAPAHLLPVPADHAAQVLLSPAVPAQPVAAPAAAQAEPIAVPPPAAHGAAAIGITARWAEDAEQELKKIPFFVRGKARRNTERYASDRGLATITVETLYDAKAHFSR